MFCMANLLFLVQFLLREEVSSQVKKLDKVWLTPYTLFIVLKASIKREDSNHKFSVAFKDLLIKNNTQWRSDKEADDD